MKIAEPLALEGGRTNHVIRRGDEVWKHYNGHGATPLFANDPDAEWCALQALNGQAIAPRAIRRDKSDGKAVLVYGFVEGATHATRKEELARLLGRLHALPIPNGLPKAAMGADVVAMGLAMAELSDDLLRIAPNPPAQEIPPRFCHRDAVPGNIVQTDSGPILIDWQCPAAGDPVEDIAHALSPAMHVLYGASVPTGSDIAAFLAAYPDRGVVARYAVSGRAYHWRMACYCFWQITRGNSAYDRPLAAEMRWLADNAKNETIN